MFRSLKSESTSLILLGVLAIIVGIIAIAWPGVTILALVILFAVYAFMDAGLQMARSFIATQTYRRILIVCAELHSHGLGHEPRDAAPCAPP